MRKTRRSTPQARAARRRAAASTRARSWPRRAPAAPRAAPPTWRPGRARSRRARRHGAGGRRRVASGQGRLRSAPRPLIVTVLRPCHAGPGGWGRRGCGRRTGRSRLSGRPGGARRARRRGTGSACGAGHCRGVRTTALHGVKTPRRRARRRGLATSKSLLPDLVLDPDCLRRHRHARAGHETVLFLVLTGLADGLAPKERRYARARDSPQQLWVPRFLPLWSSGAGIQLYGRGMLTAAADRTRR